MKSESEDNLAREKTAIQAFVALFHGSFKKLDPNDVDYRILNKDGSAIAYAEVTITDKKLSSAYPLQIHIEKLSKLIEKRLGPVLIWVCDDGILYANAHCITGEVKSNPEKELMVYYGKQKTFKYIRY